MSEMSVASKAAQAFTASSGNVAKQAKLMESAGTPWHAVKYGNLELITRLFPGQCNVYEQGPVGDNVFHIAMLLNTPTTLAIARYLVKLYGKVLVNTPYQERKKDSDPPGLYEGETAIHIAIVNRDFDMVKFLVYNGADVRARAYGGFFRPGSPCFYGEYPLSFAVCTGQKDIVSYLKRHGARVNTDRDMLGNTALHMCVYHNQLEMYQHLIEFCGANENTANYQGLTPLLLAANLGKAEMFTSIYSKRRKVAWSYGPVTSYSLSLREIDTVQDEAYVPSAVEIIVRKRHTHMLDDPLVQTLLEYKWNKFARFIFLAHMLWYLLLVLVQTFLIWLHSDQTLWNSRARAALEYISLVFTLGLVWYELSDFTKFLATLLPYRKMQQAAPKHLPPLYAIPGLEEPPVLRSNSRSLTRALSQGMNFRAKALQHEQSGKESSSLGRQATSSGPLGEGQEPPTRLDAGNGMVSTEELQEVVVSNADAMAQASAQGADNSWWIAMDAESAGASSQAAAGRYDAGPLGEGTEQQGASNQAISGKDADQVSSLLLSLPASDPVSVGRSPPAPSPTAAAAAKLPATPRSTRRSTKGQEAPPALLAGRPIPSFLKLEPPKHATSNMMEGGGKLKRQHSAGSSIEGSEFGMVQRNGQRVRGRTGGDIQPGHGSLRRDNSDQHEDKDDAEDDRNLPTAVTLKALELVDLLGTLASASKEYFATLVAEPLRFVILLHLLLGIVHFVVWQSSYGMVNGHGPHAERLKEFDDVIIAIIAVAGWLAMLVFTRGFRLLGTAIVYFERCLATVVRFMAIFAVVTVGFALAFYTLLNGTTITTGSATQGVQHRLHNIGYVMAQLVRFMYGEAEYETFTQTDAPSKQAFATMLWLLYIALVLLLGLNVLIAMLVAATHDFTTDDAKKCWRIRWASMVLRAEYRLPRWLQQRFRLGTPSIDPKLRVRVHNHVFEVVEENAESPEGDATKALEAALERMRKVGRS